MAIFLKNVKIETANGGTIIKANTSTDCTLFYDVKISDKEQNPVTAVIFVLSDLKIAINPASWQKTIIPAKFNTCTQIITIHSSDIGLGQPLQIKVSLSLKDQSGDTIEQFTSFTLIH
jgi:hypothetical protein